MGRHQNPFTGQRVVTAMGVVKHMDNLQSKPVADFQI
jgi:hypothetical protein